MIKRYNTVMLRIICALLTVMLLLSGCSPPWIGFDDPFPRTTWPQVATSLYPDYPGPAPGQSTEVHAPFAAYVTVSVRPSSSDPAKYWTKAEVNYGDGAGWQDITPQARYFWKHGGATPTAYVHKEFGPGEYHVRSRATFYDGAVQESNDYEEIYLTVLP